MRLFILKSHASHKCGLLLQMSHVLDVVASVLSARCLSHVVSASVSVFLAHGRTVQKRQNRSRAGLRADSCGPNEPCIRWRCRCHSGKMALVKNT